MVSVEKVTGIKYTITDGELHKLLSAEVKTQTGDDIVITGMKRDGDKGAWELVLSSPTGPVELIE